MSVKIMNEDMNGVENVEAETTAVPAENNEQVQEPAESVIPTTDGKDYKAIAEQLSRDIQQKNREKQELKNQISNLQNQQPAQQVSQPVLSDDDTVKRFLQTEANATIAVKLQTDPSFRDRVEIVQEYVAQGYDITMADKLAKADIMDKILNETSTPIQHNIPQQIQPTAIPEQVRPQPTGNSLNDIQTGKVQLDLPDADALRDVLAKYRPQ